MCLRPRPRAQRARIFGFSQKRRARAKEPDAAALAKRRKNHFHPRAVYRAAPRAPDIAASQRPCRSVSAVQLHIFLRAREREQEPLEAMSFNDRFADKQVLLRGKTIN